MLRFVQIVGRDEDGDAGGGQLLDEIPELTARERVDAASRLVRDIDRYPGLHWITNVSGRIPISLRMRFELGFTENFMDQMSTTDFGVHFGLAVRP